MKFLTLSKFFLIFISPVLLFLFVSNLTAFDNSFYREKFSEYKIQQDLPQANVIHEKVINYIKGKNDELPNQFNEREKHHLWDVRKFVYTFNNLMYILIALFVMLSTISLYHLKINRMALNFFGKILFFGGLLTLIIALVLSILLSMNFSTTFELFHKLFFENGTYVFDPSKEIIVRLYPEQLFMDIGIKILKGVVIASFIAGMPGLLLIYKSKNKKIKKENKKLIEK